MSDQDCIFCKIVAGELPSSKVYEDDDTLVLMNIHPVNPGHVLVIPKTHVDHFDDMGGDLYAHVMSVVQKISRAVKKTLQPKRVGLMVQGFEVSHAHVHVIPLNDPHDIASDSIAKAAANQPDQGELEKLAQAIAKNA